MDKSEEFYFAPLLKFEVEGKTFCVPREFFMQSSHFVNYFNISSLHSEEEIIPIEVVKADEFTAFLKLLIGLPPDLKQHELSEAELESALRLSCLWDFEFVRALAIVRLEALSLEPSHMIHLAHTYKVDHWLVPENERLALVPENLTFERAERLGLKTVVKTYNNRDKKRSSGHIMRRALGLISQTIKKFRERPAPNGKRNRDTNKIPVEEPLIKVGSKLSVEFASSSNETRQGSIDSELRAAEKLGDKSHQCAIEIRDTSNVSESDGELLVKAEPGAAQAESDPSITRKTLQSSKSQFPPEKTSSIVAADGAASETEEELECLVAAILEAKTALSLSQYDLGCTEWRLAEVPECKGRGKGKVPQRKAAEKNAAEAQNKVNHAMEQLEAAEKALKEYDEADGFA